MKALLFIVMNIILTASLLTGCGCTNRNIEKTPEPTVLPTNEEIWNTTEHTTVPTTSEADPSMSTTHETKDSTTIPTTVPDNTADTLPTNESMVNRARRMLPDIR